MYAARAIFGARRYLIYSPCVLNFALDYNLKSLKRVPAFYTNFTCLRMQTSAYNYEKYINAHNKA